MPSLSWSSGREFQFCSPKQLKQVPHPAFLKHCGSQCASEDGLSSVTAGDCVQVEDLHHHCCALAL